MEECQTSHQFLSFDIRLRNSKDVGKGYYKEKDVYTVSAMPDIMLTANRMPAKVMHELCSLNHPRIGHDFHRHLVPSRMKIMR